MYIRVSVFNLYEDEGSRLFPDVDTRLPKYVEHQFLTLTAVKPQIPYRSFHLLAAELSLCQYLKSVLLRF